MPSKQSTFPVKAIPMNVCKLLGASTYDSVPDCRLLVRANTCVERTVMADSRTNAATWMLFAFVQLSTESMAPESSMSGMVLNQSTIMIVVVALNETKQT
jgi:hypothetical protein